MGTVAGVINMVAGGGSMLTVPALIFMGLPPTVANGTNRVALLAQNVGGVWGFQRSGLIRTEWLRFAGPPAIFGAILGTWMATIIPDASFQRILGVVMVLIAAYTLWDPVKGGEVVENVDFANHPLGKWGFRIAFFLVGVYGGFIQIGVGFIVLALATSAGLDLVRGSAMKVLLVLAYTIPALVMFTIAGKVNWPLGLALAAGTITGATLGVKLAIKAGHVWIKRFVTVVVLLLAGRLLLT
ncbi:MAG: sulfite exporter TauE/SafE family protein [Longimicrobiales bacterium]